MQGEVVVAKSPAHCLQTVENVVVVDDDDDEEEEWQYLRLLSRQCQR